MNPFTFEFSFQRDLAQLSTIDHPSCQRKDIINKIIQSTTLILPNVTCLFIRDDVWHWLCHMNIIVSSCIIHHFSGWTSYAFRGSSYRISVPTWEYLMIVEHCEERIRHVCNQCIDIDTHMHYIIGIYIYIYLFMHWERENETHKYICLYVIGLCQLLFCNVMCDLHLRDAHPKPPVSFGLQ